MAENELVFGVRAEGSREAAAEILTVTLAAEEAARRVAALNARAVTQASARVQGVLSGASGGSVQGDVRAAVAAARLEQAQQRVAISAQNVAAAQVRADAATVRAATSYQKATETAEKLASGSLTLEQSLGRVGGALRNAGLGLTSLGSSLSIALTAPLAALAAFSASSAKDIDSIRNRLIALEGSVDGANQRLLKNQELARRSIGVTNELANHSFALFKAINKEGASLTDQTIERIIAGVGRLNAAFSIEDLERFNRNLVQIFTVNFNQRDIREALRQVPIFNQLLERAFGTSDPDRLRKLKASGKLTLDAFISGLATAVETDPRLSQIGESIGTRLTKTFDRIKVALAPIGDAILNVLERAVGTAEPLIAGLARAFASIPAPLQTVVVLLGTFAAVTGPTLFVVGQLATGIGGLISGFGRLNTAGILPTVQNFNALTLRMQGAAAVAAEQVAAQEAVTASTLRFTAAQGGAAVSGSVLTATVVEASVAEEAFSAATNQATAALARQAVAQKAAQISTVGAVAGWLAVGGAILGIVVAVAAAAAAFGAFGSAQEKSGQATLEQVKATNAQVGALKNHIEFVGSLRAGVALTTKEQDKLKAAYAALGPEAQARVGAIRNETKFTSDLSAELQRLLDLKGREREQQAATLAATLAANLAENQSSEQRITGLRQQIDGYTALAEVIRGNGAALTDEQRALAALATEGAETGLSLTEVEANIRDLNAQAAALRKTADGLNGTIKEQSDTLKALGADTDEGVRRILLIAKSMSLFKGDVDSAVAAVARFRQEQGEAGKETGKTTLELDEQTESLKQLKRALAEAEIAAKSRAAAAQRSFDEERTSSRQLTDTLIKNAEERKRAELAEIEEGLKARRASLEGTSDDKEKKKLQEEISQLELRRTKVTTDADDEIENLKSAQRIRERDETVRHNESLLSIERTNAEARIAVLRDAAERDESLRLQNEREVIKIEKELTASEIAELKRRRDSAAEGTDARVKIEDELNQKLAERRRQNAEQRRRDAQFETDETLRQIRLRAEAQRAAETEAQGQIDRLRDAAERGRTARALIRVPSEERDPETGKLRTVQRLAEIQVKTFADTERVIKDIVDRGFAERIKLLNDEIAARLKHKENVQGLTEQVKTLEQERANAAEDASRRIRDAEEQTDPRVTFERAERVAALERQLGSARLAARQAVLNAVRSSFGRETALINERYDIERKRLEIARDDALSGLNQREADELDYWRKNVATDEEFNRKKLEVQKKYDELRKAENDRANAEITSSDAERKAELERRDPNSDRSLFGDTFANAAIAIRGYADEAGVAISGLQVTLGAFGAAAGEVFAQASAEVGNFFSITLNGIQQVVAGLGDMVQNWALVGEVGPNALRKLLASTLAYYAKTFIIKAADNIGEGFSNLAKASAAAASGNLASAALYHHAAVQNFISAAKYGIAGIAVAGAARIAAGDSFKQKDTASRALGQGGGDATPNNRQFNYGTSFTESASSAAREGSGGTIFERMYNKLDAIHADLESQHRRQTASNLQVAQTLSRIQSMPPGDVVAIGAPDAKEAIGVAVIEHSSSNYDFVERLTKNQGFG